jgi:2-dehydropantoate 2-reductase
MRFAIFGAGAIGGYFGGKLAAAGEDVTFIARGETFRAIREGGLRVESIKGDFILRPAKVTDDPATLGPIDVILLGVKAWQVPEAAQAIRPFVESGAVVLPLQNGVEAPAQLMESLGRGSVLGGLARIFAFRIQPGWIRHVAGPGSITFGELDNHSSERCRHLLQRFLQAGIPAEIPSDIQVALWEKLVFISSFGGLSSLTRSPIGILRTLPQTRQMLEQGMEEVVRVAQGHSVPLTDEARRRAMAMLESLPPEATPSLQRDIVAGRPSELEAWNGAVVRLGREKKVSTPLHAFFYSCLLPMELKARGQLDFPA